MHTDVLCAGILVADHLCPPIPRVPLAGELILVDELPLQIGGCAANTAIDLAGLNLQVSVLGCVGSDAFGGFITETLQQRAIDTRHIRRATDCGTSGTLIINVQGEDRRFIHAIGANGSLRAEDIPAELVTHARVFYVGGYLLLPGLAQEGLWSLFRTARRAGVKTVLDVVLPGPGDHWRKLDKLLSETDVFLPNDDEAAAITGLDDPLAQAERFRQAGAGTVVITCGEKGTFLVSETERLHAAVYDVPFVGGTGAGDAFDAGYIAGLLQGLDAEGCLKWGSALGASSVRGIAATETVFNRHEAEEFIAARSLKVERI